jgi:hypothetical protein
MREQLKSTLDQAKAASITQQVVPSATPSN